MEAFINYWCGLELSSSNLLLPSSDIHADNVAYFPVFVKQNSFHILLQVLSSYPWWKKDEIYSFLLLGVSFFSDIQVKAMKDTEFAPFFIMIKELNDHNLYML